MSALQLPTGGARFRPTLEDLIQFLIADCRFDADDSWEAAVARSVPSGRGRRASAARRRPAPAKPAP